MGQGNQLSVNAQIGLVLGVLCLFSVILTFVGYMAGDQVRQKIALFASEPVVTTGLISGKHYDIVRPTQGAIEVDWLDVRFTTESGEVRKDSQQVVNTVYARYSAGDPVEISYARSKPEWFFVPGTRPTSWDITTSDAMFEYGAMGSVFFLICFVAWYFVGRDGPQVAPRSW